MPSQRDGFGLGAATGIGIGAGLMFFFDPDRGRKRRARFRDQAVRTVHDVEESLEGRARDAAHRAAGALAEARGALRAGAADDDVIRERVRSKLGRVVAHPHELETHVQEGCVRLSGRVASGELSELLDVVRGVRGVREVSNELETYEGPARPFVARHTQIKLWMVVLVVLALARFVRRPT